MTGLVTGHWTQDRTLDALATAAGQAAPRPQS